ncbi:DUF4190 domain-containing protein [Canibacter zhoujuaniae]|uniref:DUF4190 domain-containing protein n=1 Tax=Canibacter zhoujuaniae TaxID=2708343 RepID=UPI001420D4AF|nr:DUF4190 domain-containing protein [Canibacter zhoujuaniae]
MNQDAPQYPQNTSQQPSQPYSAPAQPPLIDGYTVTEKNGNGLAITSLVTGILAFLFSWVTFFGGPAGLVAVITGILAGRKKQRKGLWITGIVLGAIGLIFVVVWILLSVWALSMLADPEALRNLGLSEAEVQEILNQLRMAGVTE